MQALVVTTAGGLAMLVGIVLLGHAAGTYRLSEILADPPQGTTLVTVAIVLPAGRCGHQVGAHPVPLLAARRDGRPDTGQRLPARRRDGEGRRLPGRTVRARRTRRTRPWRAIVVTLGVGTMLLGGYRALRQHDLKLLLAFGTVSQLGLIVLLVGLGTQATALAGLAMLGAHAMFKAALFLVVGVVDAATGTRDLRRLSGVGRELPWTAAAGALATASMIGLPPFAGFVAKEAALESLAHLGDGLGTFLLVAVAVGSVLTVAYGLRLWWGAFATKRVVSHESVQPMADGTVPSASAPLPDGTAEPAPITHPSMLLVWPAMVLALLGLAVALLPGLGENLLQPYADQSPTGEPGHLALWAGLTPTLGLTVLILAAGLLLFLVRDRVERLQAGLYRGPEADRVYRRFMRRLDDVAADVTAVTQRGSLPLYLGGILVVFVVGVGTALIVGGDGIGTTRWWDQPAQVVVGGVAIVSAVLAARARRRLKAVILVGVGGYAVAGLFLLHGAPDLALTQVLVETVTLVVFVLVLRRLPPYFSDRPLAGSRWLRLAVGLGVGLTVAGIALVVPGARVHTPVSEDFAQEAVQFGGGTNIVNVTLVDIRAWDTMGEISVLLVAATGVASLVFLSRRSGAIFRAQDAPRTGPCGRRRERPDGRAAPPPGPGRRRRGPAGRDGLRGRDLRGAGARVAARRPHARPATTVRGLRGRHPAAVPHDDRLLGLPAVLRAQRPRRRVRRRAWSPASR